MPKSIPVEDYNGYNPTLQKTFEKTIKGVFNSSFDMNSVIVDLTGFNSFTAQFWTGGAGSNRLQFSFSNDGIFWTNANLNTISFINTSNSISSNASNNEPISFCSNKKGKYLKISQSASTTSIVYNILLSQSSISDNDNYRNQQDNIFSYNSSTAITNTTVVTLFSALSPALIFAIEGIQISNANTGGTEVIFKSGSTVIYRTYINGNKFIQIPFNQCIFGLKSQSLTVELSSSTNVGVYVNLQGKIVSANS